MRLDWKNRIWICLLLGSLFLSGCGLPQLIWQRMQQKTESEAQSSTSEKPDEQKVNWKEFFSLDVLQKVDVENLPEYRDNLPEGPSLFRNAATEYYYYELLDELEQDIYRALWEITRDPTSTDYHKKIYSPIDPDGDAFADATARAYQALIFDHPELFWFRQSEGNFDYYYLVDPKEDGTYIVLFELTDAYENYEAEMTRFNAAVDAFLSDIDRDQSDALIALQIHDALIDLVSYDTALSATYVEDDDSYDYGYSAYGALVENSRGQAHLAVCDGYSYAYEYLLQQVGIRATRIGGYGGDSEDDLIPHSWNLVWLDGDWYEVDATWDDQELSVDPYAPENSIFLQATQDAAFWGKIRHHMFNRTTEEMNYFAPDDSYVFYTEDGYASFLGPSVHVRDTKETMVQEDMLSYLAPIAEGTADAYENLVAAEAREELPG